MRTRICRSTMPVVTTMDTAPNTLRIITSTASRRTTAIHSSRVIRFPPSSQAPASPINEGAM